MEYSTNTSEFTIYSSTQPDPNSPYKVLLLVLGIPFCFITIVGNLFVIISWAITPPLRTPPNILIISLAVVDLLIGLTSIPLGFVYIYHEGWAFGEIPGLCQFSLICDYGLMFLSANHLVLIALDRYRILTEGVSYVQRRNVGFFLESVVALWFVGGWLVSPIVLDWENVALDPRLERHCIVKKSVSWSMLTNLTDIILPMYLLGRIYSNIFSELGKRWDRKRVATSTLNVANICVRLDENEEDESSLERNERWKKEKQTTLTLSILIGAFYVCWSPYLLASLIDLVVEGVVPSTMFYYLALVGMTNSTCNPFIYAVRVREFREAFGKIVNPVGAVTTYLMSKK